MSSSAIQNTSWRGVMATRTGRSPRRRISSIITCSSGSIRPAEVPSARIVATSSWVTSEPSRSLTPISFRMPDVDAVSSRTKGFISSAMVEIGAAILEAMASGKISASRLGTSSPTITDT